MKSSRCWQKSKWREVLRVTCHSFNEVRKKPQNIAMIFKLKKKK